MLCSSASSWPFMAEPPAPADGGEAAPNPLQGLAKAWENDEVIRHSALKNWQLLKWPTQKLVGVISFETIAYNARVVDYVLRFHCPSTKTPRTVNTELLREEVRGTKVKITWFF